MTATAAKRTGWLRAVATLASGQGLAALAPLAAAPALGRLYTPADYGALAAFLAFGGLFHAIGALQLQYAIIAEADEQNAEDLVWVCLAAAAATALAATPAAFGAYWLAALSEAFAPVAPWALLLPFTSFAAGAIAGLGALANRRAQYGALARIPLAAALVTATTAIWLGLVGWTPHGLFIAYAAGQAVALAAHLRLWRTLAPHAKPPSVRRGSRLAQRHRRFVFFTLPAQFVGALNQQMPAYALAAIGAAPLLGAFNRARQLAAAPMSLLGAAAGQVFQERAAAEFRASGSCRALFVRAAISLALIGAPACLALALAAPTLFAWVLGPNWTEAGEIAALLAPMLLLRLICSPLSSVFYVAGAQRLDFFLSCAATTLLGVCVAGPLLAGWPPRSAIAGYALGFSLTYAVYLAAAWRLSEERRV